MRKRTIVAAAALCLAPAIASAADCEPGFYKHPLHGGGTAYKAQIVVKTEDPQPGDEIDVNITVDGVTTKTTATAGEDGNIAEMDAVTVEGGHEIKIIDGKSQPRSRRKGNATWKVMKDAQPANGARSGKLPHEPAGLSSGTDGDVGVGSLPAARQG